MNYFKFNYKNRIINVYITLDCKPMVFIKKPNNDKVIVYKIHFYDNINNKMLYDVEITDNCLPINCWAICNIKCKEYRIEIIDKDEDMLILSHILLNENKEYKKIDLYKENIYLDENGSLGETPLCEIMKKHGSDKSTYHNYTLFYHALFQGMRYKNINLFELGIGSNDVSILSNMGKAGKPGASLRGWREYFKNARIYGADIDKKILFKEKNIETFYCDSLSSKSIKDMFNQIDVLFDIIIDDGLHTYESNFNFLINSFNNLKSGGYYIIEDVYVIEQFNSIRETLLNDFEIEFIDIYKIPHIRNKIDNNLIIIKKKEDKKRCFVTFYSNEDYELNQVLVESINKFSKYNILSFTHDDFSHLDIENRYRCPIFIQKVLSYIKCLQIGFDEVVWLDSDIIAFPKIDNIWNNTCKIEDYSLLPVHFMLLDPYNLLNNEKKYFNCKITNNTVYLHACISIFNKNCLDFFNKVLDKYLYVDHRLFPFGDESIMNCLIWEKEEPKNLGRCYIQYDYKKNSEYIHGKFIFEKIKKDEILAFHGCKEKEISREYLKRISENFC